MTLDPKTKRTVGLPKVQIKYIAKKVGVTYQVVLDRIKLLLEYVLDKVTLDMELWIQKYVPKRTGQLQDSLIKNLGSSWVKNGLLKIIMGTHIDYAPDVDAMNAMMVRHLNEIGYAYYYGHHGKINLYDPRAIGGFFETMLTFMNDRVTRHIAIGKDIYFGAPGKINVKLRRLIE